MYYSKNTPSRHGENIIIPENYSGNAFREEGLKHIDETSSSDLPNAEVDADIDTDIAEAVPVMGEQKSEKSQRSSLLSFLLPPKSNGAGGFLHNIDTEDIVILVLLFLMYQSDSDDDVSLLLLLLLFLK